MAQTAIIVPCRLESTRFPRKLLHTIKGKPLLLWVAERIAREMPGLPLWFAVDDELLAAPLRAAGFRSLMTSSAHQSGTDRLAEANRIVRADHIINVQADEPLVSSRQLRTLAELIAGSSSLVGARIEVNGQFKELRAAEAVHNSHNRLSFVTKVVDIHEYAGQTVTIYIDQDYNHLGGFDKEIYIDKVRITAV